MKSGHNNRQNQPIANATDDSSGALIHTYTLAPTVCTAADSPTANGGRDMMNACGSVRARWCSMAILSIAMAGYGTVSVGTSKNLRIRG